MEISVKKLDVFLSPHFNAKNRQVDTYNNAGHIGKRYKELNPSAQVWEAEGLYSQGHGIVELPNKSRLQ